MQIMHGKKALEKGHKVTEMNEAWYFETIFQYNTQNIDWGHFHR